MVYVCFSLVGLGLGGVELGEEVGLFCGFFKENQNIKPTLLVLIAVMTHTH